MTSGYFDIPELAPCLTWPVRLFNYELKTRESRVPGDGLHFFADDYRLERFWRRPHELIGLAAQADILLSPDFSVHFDAPRVCQAYNVFRNRYLGVYAATTGVQVIPTVRWYDEASYEYCFAGLPSNSILAISSQSIDRHTRERELFDLGLIELVGRFSPVGLVVYGERAPLPELPGDLEIRRYPTHMAQVKAGMKVKDCPMCFGDDCGAAGCETCRGTGKVPANRVDKKGGLIQTDAQEAEQALKAHEKSGQFNMTLDEVKKALGY